MKKVQTTEIKKKYKDKRTGEWREITINHAKVKDRLQAFWEANPRGKIETSQKKENDQIIFKAFILTDKADQYSKEATGHSYGNVGDDKSFEKLETIAVGRALALLGYATDGEVASSEEMEEFEKSKLAKKAVDIMAQVDEIKTIEELREFYTANKGNGAEVDAYIIARSKLLQNENPKTTTGKSRVAKRA
jgi:hypothetical protein